MRTGKHRHQFTAIVGHEMRNSLSAIRGALDSWLDRAPCVLDDLRHLIEMQLRALTRLSEDLLGNEVAGEYEMTLHRAPVVLQEIIAGSVDQVRPLCKRSMQNLQLDSMGEPIIVRGDTDRLTQLFSNLLQNASKFTPLHGDICVSLHAEENLAVVRIRDTGQGMRLKQLASIFEQGSGFDGQQLVENDGFGIGLKLVKAIVAAHDGSITAESNGVGCGSVFIVKLPLSGPSSGIGRSAVSAVSGVTSGNELLYERKASSLKILIVDDVRMLRESLSRLLRKEGHTVDVAANGREALLSAERSRPDVVLMDLMMPGMDGFELARRLREQYGYREMILIAVSGNDSEEFRQDAQQAGIDIYLAKPCGIKEVCKVLDAIEGNPRFAGSPPAELVREQVFYCG